jgi:acid phosphatase type 7
MLAFIISLSVLAIVAAAGDLPSQVHIALAGKSATGDSNSMAVSWNTKHQTLTSTVKYGTQSGKYVSRSTGSASAYYQSFNHHVVLGELQPAKSYYYVVGDEVSGWSEELTFRSAHTSSELRGNYSFLVFGDLGVVNGGPSTDYLNAHRDDISLVWHAGDVSYADDSFLHPDCVFKFCYEDTFDKYMNMVQPVASTVPYMTTPGNHEAGEWRMHFSVCVDDC